MKILLIALALIGIFPLQAFALGEVFKIETSGIEYCGDLDRTNFNASNNVDLWVKVVSEQELTVSITANFAPGTTFPMIGETYLTGPTTAAFVGGVIFVDNSFATIQGTARGDRRTGGVTSLTGIFIQSGVLAPNCFSSGRFTSKKISG